jgi:hypothetical protein
MERKTSDLNVCLSKLFILLLSIYFVEILSDILRCKIINKLLNSLSLRDALQMLPSYHTDTYLCDTRFTFPNYRP